MLYLSELTGRLTKRGLSFNLTDMDQGRTEIRRLPGLLDADDIVLMANSTRELQALLDICVEEATRLALCVNPKKSAVITEGATIEHETQQPLWLQGSVVEWGHVYRYLGTELTDQKNYLEEYET